MAIRFPEMAPGAAIRISASTYVAYRQCPARAGARLQGVFGADTRPAFLGGLAHRMFSRHLSTGPIAFEDFAQACKEEIGGSALNNKLGSLALRPSTLAAVIEEVRELYQRFVKLPGEGFEGSEQIIDTTVGGGVDLVGTVDAVFREDLGGHRLVDWKTGELGDPEDQLLFYAVLWILDRGELPAHLEAVSVRTGERYRTVPSAADVSQVAGEIAGMVDAIRASWASGRDLDRVGGPWCRHCPLLDECPEGKTTTELLD